MNRYGTYSKYYELRHVRHVGHHFLHSPVWWWKTKPEI